jgi:hypothetical protein
MAQIEGFENKVLGRTFGYLVLGEMKCEDRENCTVKHFIICTLHKILLG